MSDFETIARPYAKAAFAYANDAKQLDQWSEFLAFAALATNDEVMVGYLTSPGVLSSDKASFIIDVLEAGLTAAKVTDEQRNFIKLLSENRRLNAFDAICDQYEALKRDVDGVVEVRVISARKLTAAQTKAMTVKLKARLGKDILLTAEVDATLLAGAVIYANDVVIDGTARGKLNKLASALNK